jgi:hypothetical protein
MIAPHISIGFVAPPAAWLLGHATSRLRRALALVVLALAACALAAAAWAWHKADRARALVPALPVVRAPVTQPAAVAADAPTAAERARINRAVRVLNTPWASIFRALEAAASPKVAVLAVEPDVERGAVRVQTEGPELDALLQHAQRLQDGEVFAHAQLLRIDARPAPAGELARLSFDLVLAR